MIYNSLQLIYNDWSTNVCFCVFALDFYCSSTVLLSYHLLRWLQYLISIINDLMILLFSCGNFARLVLLFTIIIIYRPTTSHSEVQIAKESIRMCIGSKAITTSETRTLTKASTNKLKVSKRKIERIRAVLGISLRDKRKKE